MIEGIDKALALLGRCRSPGLSQNQPRRILGVEIRQQHIPHQCVELGGIGPVHGPVRVQLLQNFDTEYSARLVLGQSWRTATPEQRKRFVDAFYHSLLRNYGAALVDFTGDRFIVLPYKGDPGDTTATVRTEVKRSTGDKVPVNFSLRKTPEGWKAWDVVIEGISYVKSFRTDFASEIQQKGLDDVITRLEKEGRVGPNGAAVAH